MHDYITHITLMKGSGEYCICECPTLSFEEQRAYGIAAHILAPGAHARMPLVDRIAQLKIPVTFVCM